MSSRPNILFIMCDDHASHAISAYGSVINQTPQIDRIAQGGVRLENCFCTNSICTPSRATILTGQYGHVSGVRTLADDLDGRAPHLLQKQLQATGYQTAMIGKWHLGHGGDADPTGFDFYSVLQDQGPYFDPEMIENGQKKQYTGYTTDILTEMSTDWLSQRDADRPFFLCCHHKAPHRPWDPAPRHQHLFDDHDIPEPDTFYDDYANRSLAAAAAAMRIGRDSKPRDVKGLPPKGLDELGVKRWAYQRYIKDYLRCVAAVDESVGTLLDYLDEHGLAENTIVVYTSDQGFFLGDHGWYDKRFMYEHSLRMPMLVRYPTEIPAGSVCGDILTNTDFAPTLLDYADAATPDVMQGVSGRAMLRGDTPDGWQDSLYYRYWVQGTQHRVTAHYGVRTKRYKLIHYYGKGLGLKNNTDEPMCHLWQPEWELFDLHQDPDELRNVFHDPAYRATRDELIVELERLQAKYGDTPEHEPVA